jgi:hypothetical protein
MDENIIQSVALFFYLNLFDSRPAFSASQHTLAQWRDLGTNKKSDLIPIAQKMLKKTKAKPGTGSDDFILPKNLDLAAWMEFKKRSDSAEYETVLWSRILGFSDEDVATGLGVTEGTVRHRVNRGLRDLGRLL